jgi:DNA-binding NarL/FixJ family response regulator
MSRLLVVADDGVVVGSVRSALGRTAEFEVVAVDGRHCIRSALRTLDPDVVLIDDLLRAEETLARVREAAEETRGAKTVLLTSRMNDLWLEQVFAAGAHAAVSKAIDMVALGTLLRETFRSNIFHRFQRPAIFDAASPLTSREKEILRLAAAGYTNGRIARELWITEQTVKFHLSNTYRKLGVSNRTQASRYAYRKVAAEQLAS